MSTAFLIASLVGLVFVVNALRPLSRTVFSVASFFAGWLTAELAPHLLVIHVGVSAWLASAGVGGWQGAVSVGASIAIAAGLAAMIAQANDARTVTEEALREALGHDYARPLEPERPAPHDLRLPWRQLVHPLGMRHPDVERIRNVPYGEVRRRNLLDVYVPRARPPRAPVLVYVHGGAWINVSNKNHQGRPMMLHLASRGWICVAPNYRLSPRATFPDHLVDVKRALAWVRENIERYGGDPSFVAIAGGSAGAHLAALATLTANEPEYQPGFEEADTSVDAFVGYYGVYDLTADRTWYERGRVRFLERLVMKRRLADARDDFERASPTHRAHERVPPMFVIHGVHDTLAPVEDARRFVARAREVSASAVPYAELPGAQHAFDVFPSIRTAHVIRAVERFLAWARSSALSDARPAEPAAPSPPGPTSRASGRARAADASSPATSRSSGARGGSRRSGGSRSRAASP